MALKDRLLDFAGALSTATNAPDKYPFPEFQSYERNKADIQQLWAEIRPQLKRDLDKIEFIDGKLREMFSAFEANERDKGIDAVMAVYNLEVQKLR